METNVKTKTLLMLIAILACSVAATAQQPNQQPAESRVSLTQPAVALDALGAPALEATLRTTAPNGAPDAPVTNVRIVVKNVSSSFLTYTSGVATFYDSAGIRCGEGIFKLDAVAQNESADTDAPGLRITCAPSSWRVVATNLVVRDPVQTLLPRATSGSNLVINIDGEEHPIQLGKPMVLVLGDKQKIISVRAAP
jgi:hypothetical protein